MHGFYKNKKKINWQNTVLKRIITRFLKRTRLLQLVNFNKKYTNMFSRYIISQF